MKETKKPPYTVGQNLDWLLRTAWRVAPGLLLSSLAMALGQLALDLLQLYLVPGILEKVEISAPLEELFATIGTFTLALGACTGLHHYLKRSSFIFSSRLFHHIFLLQTMKNAETAYPNTLDPAFTGLMEKADAYMGGNSDDTAPMAMFSQASTLLTSLLGFGCYLLVLKSLEPLLVVLTIALAAVSFFVSRGLNDWEYRTREEGRQHRNRMLFVTNTVMANEMAKDMRLFNMQPWLLEVHDKAMDLYEAYCARREGRLLLGKAADTALSVARNGVAYGYLLHMALEGDLPASRFLLYFSAVSGFTAWVTGILGSVTGLHRQSLRLCEVRRFLEWPEPFRFADGAPVPQTEGDRYELRLENVSYRYPGAEKNTISRLDLTIPAGEELAIVGLNGAGKTTLVKLLCGLLDPTEGRVLLNGQDIRQYDRRAYYALFTTVFQQFSDLQSTIAANIAQTEEGIDYPRVDSCVRRAGLDAVVEGLPAGLETRLGKLMYDDGMELSGGQEQRLMLARALYKDAPLLILDEPTAALDPLAENDMYLRYDEITRGRTAVYISHRLASTRFCRRVLYMEGGAILEEGTHDQLMAMGGRYAALFEVQSRYYKEGGEGNEEQ